MISTAPSTMPSRTPEPTDEGKPECERMSDTVGQPNRRRHYRKPSRLAEYAAPRLGMRPQSVEQLLHGHSRIQDRYQVLLQAALATHDDQMLDVLLRPFECVEGAPIDGGCELEADLADAAEDEAQAHYRADRSRDAARLLLRRRAAERMASWRHDRALAAEYGIRL